MAALRIVAALLALVVLCVAAVEAESFHGSAYNSLPNPSKLSLLNGAVTEDRTPGEFPSPLKLLGLFTEWMNLTFDTSYDDFMMNQLRVWPHLPTLYTRTKLIHSVGAVALVEWKSVGNHPYTGLFKGADYGLIRLSAAGKMKLDPPTLAPGMALKFLRTNMPSSNVISMWNLVGQPEFNFFEHDFTNHVPNLGTAAALPLRLIKDAFLAASSWPTLLGSSDFASYTQEGVREPYVVFPYRLIFHPTKVYHEKMANAVPSMDILEDVAESMVANTDIYEIHAQPDPYTNRTMQIGVLRLKSNGTMSGFGDKSMFFQHVRFENDLAFRPEWEGPARKRVEYEGEFDQYYNQDLPWQ